MAKESNCFKEVNFVGTIYKNSDPDRPKKGVDKIIDSGGESVWAVDSEGRGSLVSKKDIWYTDRVKIETGSSSKK